MRGGAGDLRVAPHPRNADNDKADGRRRNRGEARWWHVGLTVVIMLAAVGRSVYEDKRLAHLEKRQARQDKEIREWTGGSGGSDSSGTSQSTNGNNGGEYSWEGLFGWTSDATCVLPTSDSDINVARGPEAPPTCPTAQSLITLAGSCDIWRHLLDLNPSAKVCVRFSNSNMTTCVWTRWARMRLQRCVANQCEQQDLDCGPCAGASVLPVCWDHGTLPPVDHVCHAPAAPELLETGFDHRRMLLTTKSPTGQLVFGYKELYSVPFGAASVHAYTSHASYSVPIEPVAPVDDGGRIELDVVHLGGGVFELVGWAGRFGLRLAKPSEMKNRYLKSVFTRPFACDKQGRVRMAPRVRVSASGGWEVFGNPGTLSWDAVAQVLRPSSVLSGDVPIYCHLSTDAVFVYPK